MGRYVVAITGASGSVYGLRLIEQMLLAGHEIVYATTPAGRDVMGYEVGFDVPPEQPGAALLEFLELDTSLPLRHACADDLFDPIASGSHRMDGMIVCPASMGFCGSVANGLASNLPERTADVMLKEHRPLIVVPRETPLSLIHLRNLTTLAEAGAIVVPAMPAFYTRPTTLDEAVNFVVGKVMDVLGVSHDLFARWGE